MSTPKVTLVTGASSGFGAMTVRALADAKHVVYVGMRDIGGRNAQAAESARLYANQHGVTLRPIEMDVLDQASGDRVDTARLRENRGHRAVNPGCGRGVCAHGEDQFRGDRSADSVVVSARVTLD